MLVSLLMLDARRELFGACLCGLSFALAACEKDSSSSTTTATAGNEPNCQLVEDGFGPQGSIPVKAEIVASGLEVPWSIAFLPLGDILVTERSGRIRLIRGGSLVPAPVATVPTVQQSESGLLGLALDPLFSQSRAFFVYVTTDMGGGRTENRVVRYILDPSGLSAREDRTIVDRIPAGALHDGGRLRIGPDNLLYIGTGDARTPEQSQDANIAAGKILRVALDGSPAPGRSLASRVGAFVTGIRNVQAFDWLADGRLVVADHGPSGELGRSGHDEISIAREGDNLGWPAVWSCEARPGTVSPLLVWSQATPPGGATYYRADAIPEWKNSLLVGTLSSEHLHRVVFSPNGQSVIRHEVYFEGEPPTGFGRLRDVVTAPDGTFYVSTSNCDGRGTCPPEKDKILRIVAR